MGRHAAEGGAQVTAAVVALATTTVVLALVIVGIVRGQTVERRQWAEERHGLVDRAIARHTGEVLALERTAAPRSQPTPSVERPVAVGL
jgi:hypothetical protein